jgi:membrane-anchored protein YejM (alkaline phosphatase superfamily)
LYDHEEAIQVTDGTLCSKLTARLSLFTVWAASAVIDCLFLVIWLIAQWGIEKLTTLLVSGFNQWMVQIFEATFAISTLAPILIYVYTDIRVMAEQSRRQIREVAAVK